jgi:hypothetical protein
MMTPMNSTAAATMSMNSTTWMSSSTTQYNHGVALYPCSFFLIVFVSFILIL